MPAPQIVPLPPGITLAAGYTIRLTAVDPTSNALVAGVVISGASIDVDPVASETGFKDVTFPPNYSYGDVAA